MPVAKMKVYPDFATYLADQSAGNRAIIRALRRFVKTTVPGLRETVKWGNGCWVAGDTPVAYVHAEPGLVQFGFFRGAGLTDPQGLLEGSGRYVRHLKVRNPREIPAGPLGRLLRQAVRVAKAMQT